MKEAADAARSAPASPAPRVSDLLLDGLATRLTEGYPAAGPMLKAALAFRSPDLSAEEGLRWLYLAWTTAVDFWDDRSWEAIATRGLQLARDAGALAVLPLALTSRAVVHIRGRARRRRLRWPRRRTVTKATGSQLAPYSALGVVAWQGREAKVEALSRGDDRAGPCPG